MRKIVFVAVLLLASLGVMLTYTYTRCELQQQASTTYITSAEGDHISRKYGDIELVRDVVRGLQAGYQPVGIREGLGGIYALYDEHGEKCAIFKPTIETTGSPKNPKGKTTSAIYNVAGVDKMIVHEREAMTYLVLEGQVWLRRQNLEVLPFTNKKRPTTVILCSRP